MSGKVNNAFEMDETNGKYKPRLEDEADEAKQNNEKINEDEKKKTEAEKPNMVSIVQLFRFSSKFDVFLMVIGILGSLANGAVFPVMMILFTNVIDIFTDDARLCIDQNFTDFIQSGATLPPYITFPPDFTLPARLPPGFTLSPALSQQLLNMNFTLPQDVNIDLMKNMREQAIWLCVLGLVTIVVSYFQVAFWLMPAERQIKQIRSSLFKSILKQDIGWFDVYKIGELTTRLSDDVNKIKEGLGDKFGSALQFVSTFLVGIIIGFQRGWKLTLVILSLSPLLFISAVFFTKLAGYLTSNELKAYAKAGAIAEEVFVAIRTVFAFNGAKKEHERYEKRLEEARMFGIKKSAINGLLMGFVWFIIMGAYALGFWYGWTLTQNIDPVTNKPEYTVGRILLVFFSIIMAVFSLGNAAPFAGTLAIARAAAYEVFRIIDREPAINSESEEGLKPKTINGDIAFNSVEFKYPSRPDVQVLNGVNLNIKAGSTVALVGSSGCGKSTCIQLMQRFYDPLNGDITIDGISLREFNINYLRNLIGVVNQEPILFQTTIAENIKLGRDGVNMDDIIAAAKDANAHDFIMNLPQQYETLVGNRGSQLSGGQKQRVAIARALIRNPRILLLDEATSALDNESEALVQASLDKASLGRTTIIVAHRLSTIRNADVIFAFENGRVVEYGNHEELMKREGVYYSLVVTQQSGAKEVFAKKQTKQKILRSKSIHSDKNVDVEELKTVDSTEAAAVDTKVPQISFRRLFQYNRPEWFYIFIGCIGCIVSGAVNPAFAIVFSKVISVFAECEIEDQRRGITLYCLLFLGFGVAVFISYFLQGAMFGLSGENLTRRLRSMGFQKMLSQEVAWFDDPKNDVGTLCTRLAVDAAAVQGATGVRVGFVLMNLSNLGIGIILAFAYSWSITLLILAFIPFMIASGVLQTKMLTGFSGQDKKVLEEAGQISNQAISNIRTVAILNKEKYFYKQYSNKFELPYRASIKSANLYAIMFGITNSIFLYATAAAYLLGAYLIESKQFDTTFEKIQIVFSCVIFGAQSVGQAASFFPDFTKAKISFYNLCELFDRQPTINNYECGNSDIIKDNDFNGKISFNSIEFSYPTRPDAQVLQGLSIDVNKGQRIALVGSSGCGKSTVTQLLERYYDVDDGEIKICNRDVKELNLFWLRAQIGIVSQEPILFDASIAENIAYGDNSRQVDMQEIIEAAKRANIHDFIIQLPNAYDTNVGSKGTQLSGGQKQRVAIARALIRNPKILLLDEATSALDTESEKIVQDALDKAQEGRTCIIIAHRLSTIKNADVIYVMKDGKVIESGNHDDLINRDGFYSKLYTTSH